MKLTEQLSKGGRAVIGRLISNAFMWLVILAVFLMVLAIVLTILGGACWTAISIWRVVFGFFM